MTDSGLFDMDFLSEMVDHHQKGLRDYSTEIWALLMFEAFLRRQENTPSQPLPRKEYA
jgi:asparagine synthase (glutamine-hydrolysing)